MSSQENLLTRDYLDSKLAPLQTDLAVLKWMVGLTLASAVLLVLKAFFLGAT